MLGKGVMVREAVSLMRRRRRRRRRRRLWRRNTREYKEAQTGRDPRVSAKTV